MWNESNRDSDADAIRDIKEIIENSGLTMGRIFYLKDKLDEIYKQAKEK